MEKLGHMLKERMAQVVIEHEMLRAGFAALPYLVLKDTRLSAGARLAYAILLMYAWQDDACFAGQEKMAQVRLTTGNGPFRYSGMAHPNLNAHRRDTQDSSTPRLNPRDTREWPTPGLTLPYTGKTAASPSRSSSVFPQAGQILPTRTNTRRWGSRTYSATQPLS